MNSFIRNHIEQHNTWSPTRIGLTMASCGKTTWACGSTDELRIPPAGPSVCDSTRTRDTIAKYCGNSVQTIRTTGRSKTFSADSRSAHNTVYCVTSTNNYNKVLTANGQLEGTHRVRTQAVLLLSLTLTLTFDISTQNIPFAWYPKVIPYQVWTLWDHSFLSYAADKQTDGLENPNLADRRTWVTKQWH